MQEEAVNHHTPGAWKYLLVAVGASIVLNTVFLIFPALYTSIFYGTIQVLWPLLSLLLLIRIYFTEKDPDIRLFSAFFGAALIPWSVTTLLWEVVFQMIRGTDIQYYVSGFGYLLADVILIIGLLRFRLSRKWYLSRPLNMFINTMTIVGIFSTMVLVIPNIDLNDPRAFDAILLLVYLIADTFIFVLCTKIINMDIKEELKYLIAVLGGFFLINYIADALYEIRWLLHQSTILSYKISLLTDVIYTVAMVFMALSLIFYLSGSRDKLIAIFSRRINDTRPFVRDIVENSPDAMFLCDTKGRLVMANEPMSALLNLDRPIVPGKFDLFAYLEKIDRNMPLAITRIKNGESFCQPRMEFSGTGGFIYVSMRIFPLRNARQDVSGYAGIIQDITDQLRNEQELAESKMQIELYMDIMTHDINNINQVGIGYLEFAKEKIAGEGSIGRENLPYIEKPIDAFVNSSRLINNIKIIKKVQAGEVQNQPMNLGVVLDDVVKEYSGVVERQVKINYKKVEGMTVKANFLIREVFSNLVGNAIKHSSREKPLTIDIHQEETSRDGKLYYRVSVEDDGPGVPDESKQAILDRSKGHPRSKSKGIGLYIVKALVESYGGHVWVDDRIPGNYACGTRFTVELPAEKQLSGHLTVSPPEKTAEDA